jgi:DNA polymerase elongation subunit (family B)
MRIGPDDAFVNGYLDRRDVVLMQRTTDGRVRDVRVPAEYVAYVRPSELGPDYVRTLRRWARVVQEEGPWQRLSFDGHQTRKTIFFDPGTDQRPNPLYSMPHYEADVDPIRRVFTDTGARIQRPRRAYLDIETDSRLPFSRKQEMRVLCWAITDADRKTSAGLLREWTRDAERELLEEMWAALAPYDQVAAWNGGDPYKDGDGFDFPVILARSEECGVKGVDPRRMLFVDQMVAFRRMNQHTAESGDEKRSMALQSIAMAVLGRGKKDFDASRTYEAWEAGGEARAAMVRYCINDVQLLPDIEAKKGHLDLFTTICEVCRLFPSTLSLNPTRQMDGFLLRLAQERGHHFQSRTYEAPAHEEQFKGAFVMQPKSLDPAWRSRMGMRTGIVRNVHVIDFASLYPSIILTWNMSPDTKVDGPVNGPIPEGVCRCPTTGTCFRTDGVGILPAALLDILDQRKEWNAKKDAAEIGSPEYFEADSRQMAFKVEANSFYGVLGSMYSRYHDRAIAEGVTQNGAWLIQQTIGEVERRGWQAIYGDTDSVFVIGPSEDEFRAFKDWCNKELYPRLLREQGCVSNHIKLDYEKQFDRLVMCAAKKYGATYVHRKGKRATPETKPEIKGLEYKRGDATVRASQLQERVLKMALGGEESLEAFHRVLSKERGAVLDGELTLAEIVQSKSLQKAVGRLLPDGKWQDAPGGYASKAKADGSPSALPPHVVVARELAKRGRDVQVGTRVEYVVVDAEADEPHRRAIPAEDYKGECDRHYVWESMVYPATQRLLAAAFPEAEAHWELWGRSRPPKSTRRQVPVLAGQQAIFSPEFTAASPLSTTRARPEPPLPRQSTRV